MSANNDSNNSSNGGVHHPTREPPKRMLSDIPEPKTRSGLGGVISNLVNSIVGAGIIGIPYAFREAGLITGLVLLALVAYMTGKQVHCPAGGFS